MKSKSLGRRAALFLLAVGALTGCWIAPVQSTDEAAGGAQVQRIEHRGFAGCVELAQGSTRVVIVPQWAGRLSMLDFGGGNLLKHNPMIDGRALAADVPWMPWDGNATDLMRQSDGRSQWPSLWLHPYEVVEAGPGGVALRSQPSVETGLVVDKRYELIDDGKALRYTVTITRVSGDPAEGWTIWERALMPVQQYALAPLKRGKLADGYATRDGGVIDPPDRVTVAGGEGQYLVMRKGTKEGAGLAIHLAHGWLAAVWGQGVLAMTFPIDEKGTYPHFNGATAIPWIGPDVIEMEPVGPLVHLKEGESASFTQVWRWLPLPEEVDGNDPAAVGRWVDERVGN